MLISEGWRALNAQLHEERPDFGSKVRPPRIRALRRVMRKAGARSVLDYGCGKGALAGQLGEKVRCYDPAVPAFAADPQPADLVVCWDVLEHVEPDCLDAVLDHIASLARRGVHLVIATRTDRNKRMPDGRNPHLIVEPAEWWLPRLRRRWPALHGRFTAGEVEAVWISPR